VTYISSSNQLISINMLFYFGFILCVTFVTRWSCFPTVSVELYELMNLWTYVFRKKCEHCNIKSIVN